MARSSGVVWSALMAMVWCCLWGFDGVKGSHVVYPELMSVSPAIVDNQYKTRYHFQPPRNWMNDPNGVMYYKGLYHTFYQYNPNGAVWGNIVWAHSVSKDMVNWEALEPAIYPSKPFDANGCWSGSATILPGNRPVIMYTGIDPQNRQVQNVAFPKNLSDPYLREWVKPDYNPVIAPTEGINASQFRDPTTAWYGPDRRWRLLIGTRRKNRGMAMLYRSRDFVHWIRAKHPLHSAGETGMWECPDFYPVSLEGKLGVDTSEAGPGIKYVLKNSLDLTRYDYYTVGSYLREIDRYVPDGLSADGWAGLRYDYGNFYASKTFYDPVKRRRILWGWSNESDSRLDDVTKGWAGIYSAPRTVWLDPSGRQLMQWPVEELNDLRGKMVAINGTRVKGGSSVEVSGIRAAQSDVEVTFEVSSLKKAEYFNPMWRDPQRVCELKGADAAGGVGPFGLLALASADKQEQTAVYFRIFKSLNNFVALMCHDVSRSSLRPGLWKPTFGGWVDVDIKKNRKISLRTLIDHSVVESYGAEGRTCITSRVYPSIAVGDNAHLFVFNNGAEDVRISELKAWDMNTPEMNGA